MKMNHSNRYTHTPAANRMGTGRVTVAVGAMAAIAILLLIMSIFQSRRPSAVGIQNGFLPQAGGKPYYAAAGNGLACATTEGAALYSQSGKRVAQADFPMEEPVCAGSALVSIYYSLGARGLYALYPDGTGQSWETPGRVVFVHVNENGVVTVLLEEDDTLGTVYVLDTDLTPLFRWEAGTALPLSARTSPEDVLCVCCVSDTESTLRFFRIDREKEQFRFTLPDELIEDFGFLDGGGVAAVAETELILLDSQGNVAARRPYEENHLNAWALGSDLLALATVSGYDGGSAVLTTLDGQGNVLASVSAARNVDALSVGDDAVLALFTGEEATLFDAMLEEQVSYQPESDVTQVFLTPGGMAYFAGASGVTEMPLH